MLRSISEQCAWNPGIHVISPEEENERLRWKKFPEEEGFKPGIKE